MRNALKFLVLQSEGRKYMKDLGIERRIILKWRLRELGVRV
jgi:hypothetical protein